ncbi:glutathione S-transferase family protein [filamentous cyanobacterium LEGE 11480]|uniref:Glutathione S-transferase family protein n=1 Tax=Romeriopsis navalis LEGE 11480 TaxID=2777977 RepID=A0A928VS37_9CYAN|nr:glutathione S-transferase family protein [Romeriopsis navalis]MBE9031537.1 glutathione S-transferase family protein [Romeriopsis navalis LEGE 11480]
MIKLYGGRFSRASIVHWYLEEAQIPYEFIRLDMEAGEHRQADFLAINPFGKVPTIVDGDVTLFESGAILMYLADKYAKAFANDVDRAIANQWVLFANSTLATGVFIEASREKETPILMGGLEKIFATQEYIHGGAFSVADVALGSMLNYIPMMLKLDLSDYPKVMEYMQRCASRPAFQKAMANR